MASFMGVNAEIKVNDEWSEPAVLWTVVAARKGEKKTAALKRILKRQLRYNIIHFMNIAATLFQVSHTQLVPPPQP